MARKTTKKAGKAVAGGTRSSSDGPRCGLCGKAGRLQKTDCCGSWICDDEDSYVLFSYSRKSCSRNHRRYTLCGYHAAEEHAGRWQECAKCREDFEAEMYVYFGTNEHNFEKLANPPAFEPTLCSKCGRRIVLPDGGYLQRGDVYTCSACGEGVLRGIRGGQKRSRKAGDGG